MDIQVEKDDLNQKFLTSLAPEWLMHTIVWRNRNDLDTMSLDDLYNHLKVYEAEVQTKSNSNSQNMAIISSSKNSSNKDGNTACVTTASTAFPTGSVNVATISQDTASTYIASQSNDTFWNRTGKKISIQGSDVTGFDKSKVECFNCHKMGHFVRECRAPRSQEIGRKESYRQGSKAKEKSPKALMAINGVGWDWSYMANEGEVHALVADGEAPTEFALMANTESKVFDNSLCSNEYKELEELKLEKGGLDGKLARLLKASKNLDHLIKSQRSNQVKEGVGYNAVPPAAADLYLSPKKDLSRTGLPEFIDATVTDYSRPSPTVASTSAEGQIKDSSTFEDVASPNPPKPFVKFVKPKDSQSESKTKEQETPKKAQVKYPEQYRHSNKSGGHRPHGAPMRPSHKSVGHRPYRPSMRPSNRPAGHRPHGPSMSPIRPNMNECIVLGRNFKLLDDANILLRTPRQHNMYSIDLLTCLVAKASADECILWHRRLGHLNVKTMNKLMRHNLVRGLPTKSFDNDHTCTACLKGKQHKASCKSKLVNSVTKPLHTLHMDLFGPTSVSSISHKWYCLVMTDDFSRFTWTFFLRSKDENSDILKKFITEIENLKDLKVKIIRCDNGGEFRNKEMNDFCSQKGIKREFSNARTPQQNGVAERRNRTLIEAARTMVLVNKSQNKTPYELFNGRTPAIGFLKPFGCHVMILNTLDNLGKFEEKGDDGYFIGYSMFNKAFRVFNKRTRRVEENLHVEFLENKAIEKGAGPNWLFDIDSLTKSMNYVPVDAGTNSTNFLGTKDAANQEVNKDVSSLRYIALPNWAHDALLESSSSSRNLNLTASSSNPPADQMETLTVESPIPTVSSPVPTACLNDSPEPSSKARIISKRVTNQEETPSLDNILSLTNSSDEAIGVEADVSNMETTILASPTPTLRIHKDHPKSQIIGPVDTPIQTRHKSKEVEEQSFIATIYQKTDPALLQLCLFSCFLSQVEPKKKVWTLVDCPKEVRPIGTKWVLKNKKHKRGIVVRNKARLVAQGHTQEEGIDYDE
nr:hypothetical protein [Tanacetum cinerariifolium]